MLTREEKIQNLLDRQDILDCINRYTRALDRHDDELLASVFHTDAIDNHGEWIGGRDEFVQWANYVCHNHLNAHMHHVTSHTCELDGDTANTETYVLYIHRYKDGKVVQMAGGRYVDRFEKRDGEWKIAMRRLIMDFRVLADGSIFGEWDGYEKGTQDKSDFSYRRPLELPMEMLDKLAAKAHA